MATRAGDPPRGGEPDSRDQEKRPGTITDVSPAGASDLALAANLVCGRSPPTPGSWEGLATSGCRFAGGSGVLGALPASGGAPRPPIGSPPGGGQTTAGAFLPYRAYGGRVDSRRVSASAPPMPAAKPTKMMAMPRPTMSARIVRDCAPKAIRTPISRVRRETDQAMTP
jgi:hypothetical protein